VPTILVYADKSREQKKNLAPTPATEKEQQTRNIKVITGYAGINKKDQQR
jgi:aspartokinase